MKIVQGAADMPAQAFTGDIEPHAAGHPVKQLGAQFFFQPQNLSVHRTGCDKQILGRLADRSVACDFEEVFQDDSMHGKESAR